MAGGLASMCDLHNGILFLKDQLLLTIDSLGPRPGHAAVQSRW